MDKTRKITDVLENPGQMVTSARHRKVERFVIRTKTWRHTHSTAATSAANNSSIAYRNSQRDMTHSKRARHIPSAVFVQFLIGHVRYVYLLPVLSALQQEAQVMLTNPRDAFRGQSRSPNIVPFHKLGIVSFCAIVIVFKTRRFSDIRLQ